ADAILSEMALTMFMREAGGTGREQRGLEDGRRADTAAIQSTHHTVHVSQTRTREDTLPLRPPARDGRFPHRPTKSANLLEMQGRMPRILFQERVVLVSQRTNLRRKPFVSLPESAACEMLHISRDRPARWSAIASSASRSSLPAFVSRSILSSKRAASNFSN